MKPSQELIPEFEKGFANGVAAICRILDRQEESIRTIQEYLEKNLVIPTVKYDDKDSEII